MKRTKNFKNNQIFIALFLPFRFMKESERITKLPMERNRKPYPEISYYDCCFMCCSVFTVQFGLVRFNNTASSSESRLLCWSMHKVHLVWSYHMNRVSWASERRTEQIHETKSKYSWHDCVIFYPWNLHFFWNLFDKWVIVPQKHIVLPACFLYLVEEFIQFSLIFLFFGNEPNSLFFPLWNDWLTSLPTVYSMK